MHAYIHIHTHTYLHIYIHTYIRTHIHTHTRTSYPLYHYFRACSSHGFDTALNQAQLNLEILQDRVWSLEEELVSKHKIIQLLQEELPLSQRKEREQLEFRKSIGEEQMTLAQKVVSDNNNR